MSLKVGYDQYKNKTLTYFKLKYIRVNTGCCKTYFPGNTAFLLSKNAVVPSLKSSVPKQIPN